MSNKEISLDEFTQVANTMTHKLRNIVATHGELPEEEWRPLLYAIFQGNKKVKFTNKEGRAYQEISNYGRVRYYKPGGELVYKKLTHDKGLNTVVVNLKDKYGNRKTRRVDRLVYTIFNYSDGDFFYKGEDLYPLNGIKTDIRASNLTHINPNSDMVLKDSLAEINDRIRKERK